MVVSAINEETKIITAAWFTAGNEYQQGTFPASASDRVEAKKPPQKARSKKR
jgi:hypothetical protein